MAQVQEIFHLPENKHDPVHKTLSPEQFRCEIDYWRSTTILQKMLTKGLITEAEFHKIDKMNRLSFFPILASIMP